jgi:hypothetical protein
MPPILQATKEPDPFELNTNKAGESPNHLKEKLVDFVCIPVRKARVKRLFSDRAFPFLL